MRQVVNYFTAFKPGAIQVVIQEWCLLREAAGVVVYSDSRLVTKLGAPVYYDATIDHFRLANGTMLTTSDARANVTRQRMTPVK